MRFFKTRGVYVRAVGAGLLLFLVGALLSALYEKVPVIEAWARTPAAVGQVIPEPTSEPSAEPVAPITPRPAEPEVVAENPQPKPRTGFVVWMHQNDWDAAVQSVAAHAEAIAEVSPAWYAVTANGDVVKRAGVPVNDAKLLKIARDNGIAVRPLVMNTKGSDFTPDLVRPLFKDAALRKKHVAAITKLAVDNGYDGIDLDYEGFTVSEHNDLATLIEELAASLHAKDKTLAVSLGVYGSDNILPAWRRIAAAVDDIRLMAYGTKSAKPGPVVDAKWMRNHLAHALEAIPAEKLTHGMATYCFTWNGTKIGSGTWKTHVQGNNTQRDAATKSPWYKKGDTTVWCEDKETIKEKMTIGRNLGITSFALWRAGGEDPGIWDL